MLHNTFLQFRADIFAANERLVSDLLDQLEPVEKFVFEVFTLVANSKAQNDLDKVIHQRREDCDPYNIHKDADHFFPDACWK